MQTVPAGAAAQRQLLVTAEVAIDFLGDEDARVLGTPYLIGLLELTARQAAQPYLDPGEDTVGTHVDVRHLAATPLGMSVTFHAEVTGSDGRKLRFRVWAEDEREMVAEGTHERFVVNVERFAARVRDKARG